MKLSVSVALETRLAFLDKSSGLRFSVCAVILVGMWFAPWAHANAAANGNGRVATAAAKNVKELADRVDRHYDSLRTLQADFMENYSGAGITRSESGTLWIKRPGHMRWDYKQPRAKLFMTDGKTAWFYVPGERQARRAPVKSLDDLRSPLAYLLGKTKLEKEFAGLSVASDAQPESAGDVMLRGVPKNMADRVTQVLFEVTPEGRIKRIVAEGVDGATTEFRFMNQKENVPIADTQFRFSPPPGVESIESSDLGE
jgi:outer membrane lipoprotein carrier protein